MSDFTIGHTAWGVTSQFPTFISHRSSAFLRVIRLMVLATQLSAVLHVKSRVNCHTFFNLWLCFGRLSRAGIQLFRSGSVIFHIDSLYAEAIESVKSQAALWGSSPDLVWILGEINSEARLWNRSQFVNLLTGSKGFLVLIWSSKCTTIGSWTESRMSETITSEGRTFSYAKYRAHHHFRQESNEWEIIVLKFQTHLYAINLVVSRLKNCKLRYSKMDV
jgi:hypothetical protein